jgi:hypothetical protein
MSQSATRWPKRRKRVTLPGPFAPKAEAPPRCRALSAMRRRASAWSPMRCARSADSTFSSATRGAFLRRSTEPPGSSFETDVYAMVWITKAALPHLGSGSFIVYAVSADSGGSPATKAATASFAKGLASQLAGKGIRVDVLAPETLGPFWPPSEADMLRPVVEPNSA